jgi:hypothetical protein
VANLERASLPAAQKFRESYHLVARLAAQGLRIDQVAHHSGYGEGRIRQLLADPTMQARVEAYREVIVDPQYAKARDETATRIARIMNLDLRILEDKLIDAEPDDISYRDLINIATFTSDRSGYGKVTTQKVELDLADRLAKALEASSKVINERPLRVINPPAEDAA